jgi:hypothetical protein
LILQVVLINLKLNMQNSIKNNRNFSKHIKPSNLGGFFME